MKHKEDTSRVKGKEKQLKIQRRLLKCSINTSTLCSLKKNEFKEERISIVNRISLEEVKTTVEEIQNNLDKLEVKKAMGPDGMSNWVLKECSSHLAKVIHNIVSAALLEGTLPNGPPWYNGTMCAFGSDGSPSAEVRILSTV
ncbi:hypothetical protein E2C01_034568 [Portunus trituberculatus]|uniref:Uncharacterized protein n=1 Tax=Portunus trituberculatus TaxID=210409 RepID=A0A5B7F0X5_PORTR|nr:hypothetical protein [Portunus trituberculatus]